MGRNYALTTRQIAQAAEMYDKGYSLNDLERHFGCSRSAVKNALILAGVQLRPRTLAVEVALLRRFIEKPAPARRDWKWVNPANADQWRLTEQA